ncbi:transposase [Nocardia seriolae]|uniref:IS701 family transposase n=1 Tax=Nocardia seriolae TaxID=37332 RepID=UPI003F825896
MLQPCTLPVALTRVLFPLRKCFTAPTFTTCTMLVAGLFAQPATRTVCGMLTGAGLARVWHHTRAHRFFSAARWDPAQLGLVVAELIVAQLLPPGSAITVAVDDTLCRRRGKRVHAAGWFHDGSAAGRAKLGFGNNWIVLAIVVRLPFTSRPVALPVAAALFVKGGPAKPDLAREMLDALAERFADRAIHLVADSAYGCGAFAGLGEAMTMTTRAKTNAVFYAPAPPRTGKRGRPALKGDRIGTPAELAVTGGWTPVTVTRYGVTGQVRVIERVCLWFGTWRTDPVRVILVEDPSRSTKTGKSQRYSIALITTDLTSPAAEIIARYADRWAIEVTFFDAKNILGVGQARNRVAHAVTRTVPFGLFAHSILVLWYAAAGHDDNDAALRRIAAPWYRTKTEPSTLDMLVKLRRQLIAARFIPESPRPATTQEIMEVQLAWAQAAA